ncbi:hypothetical protein AB0E78_23455 [Streptomyces sp. NPDC032198]|uniref:hypothetical protein n=1 Tax=Streptomyces sp. NPDC032198 TaxID=3155127 RepID=UPI0033D78C35
MDASDEAAGNVTETGRRGRKWNTVERLLGALAALIAVIGGGVWAVRRITQDSPVEEEQQLVEQLRPGQTFDRTTEIMDDKPHYTQRLPSGNRVYQYNRKWERIQLLVDPDNISVLSVGIFADRKDFRPSFPLGRAGELTLNRTPYEQVYGGRPSQVFGSCGVHSGDYFEAYSDQNELTAGRRLAVGVHESARGNTDILAVCKGLGKAPEDCVPSDLQPADASPGTQCLTSAPAGNFRKTTAITAYVVSKQSEWTDDMFQSPYVVAGGND